MASKSNQNFLIPIYSFLIPIVVCLFELFSVEMAELTLSPTTTLTPLDATINASTVHLAPGNHSDTNATNSPVMTQLMQGLVDHEQALLKASFVILGVVLVVFLLFLAKFVRKRHFMSKTRKYGVIMEDESIEIRPLDGADEDEEDDDTIFEKNSNDKKKLIP